MNDIFATVSKHAMTVIVCPMGRANLVNIPKILSAQNTVCQVLTNDLPTRKINNITYKSLATFRAELINKEDWNFCQVLIIDNFEEIDHNANFIIALWTRAYNLRIEVPRLVLLRAVINNISFPDLAKINLLVNNNDKIRRAEFEQKQDILIKEIHDKTTVNSGYILVITNDVDRIQRIRYPDNKPLFYVTVDNLSTKVSSNTRKILAITPNLLNFVDLNKFGYIIDLIPTSELTIAARITILNLGQYYYPKSAKLDNYAKDVSYEPEIYDLLKMDIKENILNLDQGLVNKTQNLFQKLNFINTDVGEFYRLTGLDPRPASFLWYWLNGLRFNTKTINEGNKFGFHLENLEIAQDSEFSSLKPSHVESIEAVFDGENLNITRIIDATANIGMDSINFLRMYPNANIVAVEKDEGTAKILRRNFNNIEKIIELKVKPNQLIAVHDSAVTFFKQPHYADLVYFDPPWGGRDYKLADVELQLDGLGIGVLIGDILFNKYAPLVILKAPNNVNTDVIITDFNLEGVEVEFYDILGESKVDYILIFFRIDNNYKYQSSKVTPVKLEFAKPFPGIVIASLINEYGPYFFFDKNAKSHPFEAFKGHNDLDTHLNMWHSLFEVVGPNLNSPFRNWATKYSMNSRKINDLLERVVSLVKLIPNVIVGKFLPQQYSQLAKPILKISYGDLIVTHKSGLNYVNVINKDYLLNNKNSVNELVDNPPSAVLVIVESNFKELRIINFAVDIEYNKYGYRVARNKTKKVNNIDTEFGLIKDDALEMLANINLLRNPVVAGPVNIYNADISIAEKITGLKGDVLEILTDYSGQNHDKWVNKSNRNTDRYDKFLNVGKVDLYLDVGAGDGRDGSIIAEKVKAKRVILADVSDHRVDNNAEFLKLEIDNPIELENVDLITAFHVIHHSVDALFRLNDLVRILKPGGYLLIKDHNVINFKDANNVSFEHFVYSLGESKAMISDARIYPSIEPMWYYGADYIIDYVVNLGMEIVLFEEFKGVTKLYMVLFRKG